MLEQVAKPANCDLVTHFTLLTKSHTSSGLCIIHDVSWRKSKVRMMNCGL